MNHSYIHEYAHDFHTPCRTDLKLVDETITPLSDIRFETSIDASKLRLIGSGKQ